VLDGVDTDASVIDRVVAGTRASASAPTTAEGAAAATPSSTPAGAWAPLLGLLALARRQRARIVTRIGR
jgi:hypothetical protein